MNLSRVKSIVIKDLSELRANRMAMVPMIVLPVILCVVLPAILSILPLRMDISAINGAEVIERMLPAYSIPDVYDSTTEQIAYVFLNYTFAPFFMLVPVMVSSIIAANSVVGEKERKTLETLLYTPVTNKEFVFAKISSAFIPAMVISIVSFLLFFGVVNVLSESLSQIRLVSSVMWIPTIILVSPAVSLLALGITLLVSIRAKSFMEAQQVSAIVVVPIIAIVISQVTGVFIMNILHVVLFGFVILVLALILLSKVGPKFEREAILRTI